MEPKWAHPKYLIAGVGTRIHGSRWMPRGVASAVYAASTEAIALKEARHNFSRYGIQPRQKPRVLVEVDLRLSAVVALPALVEALPGIVLAELLAESWEAVNDRDSESLSQALGRCLWDLGYEGLRVTSARDARGQNLVWFPDRLRPGSSASICGEEELNRWIAT
ncbi:RES family NAD+ phosphorylase [Actomonas aquatica]|uniref:RES family NAD+ phosphorylase n=1 Tax=Actomonas aquatica TaxID=2866162 RepID=A0ABZ1CF44_9BACT|nr:RES family NAD+ phosphorylase [Opitutus sp. WL0086]WRQ90123.1 RES family NAD+ phosphorylase [Opitutus sp. WL0086]